jgi:pimeloyl-ACP methyl ester carboxylesterase
VVLLPGTLSNAAQLDRLAGELAQPGDLTIHAIDRRGMGTSRLARPAALDVDVHVRDLVAYLDARGIDRAIVVGVSFGGVVALELAARHPERILALVAWEPPYGPLADSPTQARFATLAAETANAHRKGGPATSAETFLRAVAGDVAWDRLPERARAFLAREGDGALTDSALVGLDPDGLAHIEAPTAILTGSASEPFYAPIAEALAARIPAARRDILDGLAHPAPITDAARFAVAVRQSIAEEARS